LIRYSDRDGLQDEICKDQVMAWITRNKVCRTCGGSDLTRYPRSVWMRLLKGSQLLRCRQCRSTILWLGEARRDQPSPTEEI